MNKVVKTGLSALLTGTVDSIATTRTLAFLARGEGKKAVQPTNSTSHWIHGEGAADVEDFDVAHTAIGYGTHHASAIFWAIPFEAWLATQPPRTPRQLLRDAALMSAIAATVDYTITPKRLTPGWEEVLSKRSIAATFGSMAIGLAVGAIVTEHVRRAAQDFA